MVSWLCLEVRTGEGGMTRELPWLDGGELSLGCCLCAIVWRELERLRLSGGVTLVCIGLL